VKPDFKKLGPRYGKIMKQLAAIIAEMSQEDILTFEKNGSFTFNVDGTEAVVEVADVEILSEDIPGWLVANEGRLTVALDITVTDELRREGYARELINRIQNIRKSNGYEITDKIHVTLAHHEETDAVVEEYGEYMARQVLAESFVVGDLQEGADVTELDFDTFKVMVKVVKA
jgi:isoleucyl-tRNA synthetase